MADRVIFARAILLGLNAVPKCGTPGNVLAFGSTAAFCPVETKDGHCPIGAAEYGGGRVVAFGHNGYIHDVNPASTGEKERRLHRLLRNSVIWGAKAECEFLMAQGLDHEIACGPHCENSDTSFIHSYPFGKPCRLPIAIGAIGISFDKLNKIVDAIGQGSQEKFQAVAAVPNTDAQAIENLLQNHLDIILWTNTNSKQEVTESDRLMDPRAERLLHFVRSGGAVIMAVCPWGWDQLSGGSNLETRCVFNHFLETVGLLYQGDYVWGDVNGVYPVDQALKRAATQQTPADTLKSAAMTLSSRQPVTKDQLRKAVTTLMNVPSSVFSRSGLQSRTLPPQGVGIHRDMAALQEVVSTYGAPALKFPVNLKGDLDFSKSCALLFIPWFHRYWQTIPPRMCPKALEIDHPGDVSPTTPRLSDFLFTLNPWLKGWQTTGVYVPPGEVMYITLSDQAVAAYPKLDLSVRIGCHSDWISIVSDDDGYTLRRWPKLTTVRNWKPRFTGPPDDNALSNRSPTAHSSAIGAAFPYGGLLYVEIHGGYEENKQVPITLSIDGGVLAPYYNMQLENAEIPFSSWTNSYPHRSKEFWQRAEESGAPWGELEGRYMIVSMTRDALRRIKNPEEVMKFYDDIVSHELALAGQQIDRKERYVMDRQISAGWLHSGYPIMGHLDGCDINSRGLPKAADIEEMRRIPSWGIYHELGHNRQRGEWTWNGLTEVTVNLFSLYATQMLNGLTPYNSIYFRDNCKKNAISYLQDSSMDYKVWSQSCNTALATYVVLIEQFGWRAIADVLREYEAMPQNQRPRDDKAKINEWIRKTSRKASMDLRPFYKQWKWPTDDPDLNDLNGLPKYSLNVLHILQNC